MTTKCTKHTRVAHTSTLNYIKSYKKFTQKEVVLAETPLFFPAGYEKIFLSIYFVTLPYITGLIFLFFYVAKGNLKLFSSLNLKLKFILTWAIGYEIIAALIMFWIIKMSLNVSNTARQPGAK